jgi:predicted 2-oxoglutarate/Fe(II)-dependent dioxygenase YbiX
MPMRSATDGRSCLVELSRRPRIGDSLMQPRALFSLIPGFLDAATCRQVRLAMRRGIAEPAEVLEAVEGVAYLARRALEIEVDFGTLAIVESRLDDARDGIGARHGLWLTDREGSGFLSYGPGGHYRRHVDRAFDETFPEASRRKVSAVLFLNSSGPILQPGGFSGGELVIYPERVSEAGDSVVVVPTEGTLVTFLSATAHEVRAVTAGVRDVVVDWYY